MTRNIKRGDVISPERWRDDLQAGDLVRVKDPNGPGTLIGPVDRLHAKFSKTEQHGSTTYYYLYVDVPTGGTGQIGHIVHADGRGNKTAPVVTVIRLSIQAEL